MLLAALAPLPRSDSLHSLPSTTPCDPLCAISLAFSAIAASLPIAVPARAQSHAIDRANLDTTCAACKDFFQFANGTWLKKATIPAAYSSFGSFRELADRNEAQLHKILDADAAKANATKDTPADASWKVGAFYGSCLDTASIDKLGTSPLKQELDIIAGIRSPDDLKKQLGVLEHRAGLAPWTDGSTQDSKNAAVGHRGALPGRPHAPGQRVLHED